MSEGPTTSAQAGSFAVTLPVFTGPFRLLAELILEQKVDVCDVRVADVTDHYLEHTKQAEGWNLEEATWFLAICAVLLELKVGRLMPTHTELDEDDLLGGSPDLAYARSLELAAFRKVAVEIARRLEDEAGYFARDVGPGPEYSSSKRRCVWIPATRRRKATSGRCCRRRGGSTTGSSIFARRCG